MRPETPAERRTRQVGWASKPDFAEFRAFLRKRVGLPVGDEEDGPEPATPEHQQAAEKLGQQKLDL